MAKEVTSATEQWERARLGKAARVAAGAAAAALPLEVAVGGKEMEVVVRKVSEVVATAFLAEEMATAELTAVATATAWLVPARAGVIATVAVARAAVAGFSQSRVVVAKAAVVAAV